MLWLTKQIKTTQRHYNSEMKLAVSVNFVTSNYILDELYTLLLMNIGFQPTVNYTEKPDILIAEHLLDVIWIDQYLAKRGWDVFEQYNVDKQWSFTDCTSYVVIKDFGITEVFAFDHHFEQMGFILLPSDI